MYHFRFEMYLNLVVNQGQKIVIEAKFDKGKFLVGFFCG